MTNLVAAATVALTAFAFHYWYAFDAIVMFDEGFLLDGIMRVRDGQVFARDFLLPYGPARYWLGGAWLDRFGVDLWSLRSLFVTLQALGTGALFLYATRISCRSAAVAAVLLQLVAHGAFHKSFLLVALMLVFGGLFAATRLGGARGGLIAGALFACAFLFRYDVGAFGCALVVVVLLVLRPGWRPAAALALAAAAAFTLVVGTVALWHWYVGADLLDLVVQSRHRFAALGRIDSFYRWPWQELARGHRRDAVLATVMLLVAAVYVVWLWGVARRAWQRDPRPLDPWRAAIAILGLLLLNQTRIMLSANRLFQVCAPLYLALADKLGRPGRGARAHVTLGAIVVGATMYVAMTTHGPFPASFTMRQPDNVRLELERGGLRLPPARARDLEQLIAHVQRQVPVGEPLLTSLGSPLLGFLAERPLALPSAPTYYYHRSRAEQRQLTAQLDRLAPQLYVASTQEWTAFELEESVPVLAEYLRSHYRRQTVIGRYQVFTRIAEVDLEGG